jgi:hypothetical protein
MKERMRSKNKDEKERRTKGRIIGISKSDD